MSTYDTVILPQMSPSMTVKPASTSQTHISFMHIVFEPDPHKPPAQLPPRSPGSISRKAYFVHKVKPIDMTIERRKLSHLLITKFV